MREIRARISQKHGIELSNQQIQELAARRLEAILDPRTVKPALLDQLRKSAGAPAELAPADAPAAFVFEGDTLYESHNAFLRFIRRLLNPVLKLFFNPNPLILALNAQARVNKEALRREVERDRRQAEWNALHYTILQRLVIEISRVSLEAQSLSMRVESLATKVDFNERRVRGLESPTQQPAPAAAPTPTRVVDAVTTTASSPVTPTSESVGSDAQSEGARRRRRRRRGRRGAGMSPGEPSGMGAVARTGNPVEGPESTHDDQDDREGSDSSEELDVSSLSSEQGASSFETSEVPQASPTEPIPSESASSFDGRAEESIREPLDPPRATAEPPSATASSSLPSNTLLPEPIDPPDPGPTDR